MNVANEREALFIACEMERRAIRVYERAGMLFCEGSGRESLCGRIACLLSQERTHLRRFQQMREALSPAPVEEGKLVLSAYAAQVLMPGGLMQAQRENAFEDADALLLFARDSEAEAVRRYEEFAAQCADERARAAFLAIAAEERQHLQTLDSACGEKRAD